MSKYFAPYPMARFRRLRKTAALRDLVAETSLRPQDLIWPIFLRDGHNIREPIGAMPGVERFSLDQLPYIAQAALDLGILAICLFPYTDLDKKTADCRESCNPDNLTNQALRIVKSEFPELLVMTDVALDPYNAYGHDGIVRDGIVCNDETLPILAEMAKIQAESGADILGPSDMMDGRIGIIRQTLEANGFHDVAILSYAAKYASAFYGPFRDAVGATGALTGDKKTYQMNPANTDEALRLVGRDISEGADMVMVKPGMPYLDICRRVKDHFHVPTFAYQVSGEYAMLQAAIAKGWLDRSVIVESLLAFKRAGCDGVLTYFAPEIAPLLQSS